FTQDLDFVFEASGLAILVEDIHRNITFTNSLFCGLFDINIRYKKLIHTSSSNTFKEICKCFIDAEKFANDLLFFVEKNEISSNQKYQLTN
ncbi:hypothetical protein ABTN28_19165, partial [Acinetobacter baumannii]